MKKHIQKIDARILSQINILNSKSNFIDCIVYVQDYDFFIKNTPPYFSILYSYPFLNALGIRIELDKLKDLVQQSNVIYISAQTQIYAQVSRAKKVLNLDKFYKENYFGKGITIAVIDTGLAPHLDFFVPQKKILHFEDFISNNIVPYDDNGHGTMVSGIIAGSGIKSSKKYVGVAPLSQLIVIKALNERGQTTTIEMLRAMQWLYDNHEKYNIDIVCMSFGSEPSPNDPLILGAEALWNDGMIVVSAGGNSGPKSNSIKSPGGSSKIITVGAIDDGRGASEDENGDFRTNIKLADFSSRGPAFDAYKPDVLAPGVDIISTSSDLSYIAMSGTSVSTPIIAGVCALIQEKYKKTLTPIQVKEILLSNCHTLGLDRNSQGYGYLSF